MPRLREAGDQSLAPLPHTHGAALAVPLLPGHLQQDRHSALAHTHQAQGGTVRRERVLVEDGDCPAKEAAAAASAAAAPVPRALDRALLWLRVALAVPRMTAVSGVPRGSDLRERSVGLYRRQVLARAIVLGLRRRLLDICRYWNLRIVEYSWIRDYENNSEIRRVRNYHSIFRFYAVWEFRSFEDPRIKHRFSGERGDEGKSVERAFLFRSSGGNRINDRRDGIDSRGESVRPMASLAIIIRRLIRLSRLLADRPPRNVSGRGRGRKTVIDHRALETSVTSRCEAAEGKRRGGRGNK